MAQAGAGRITETGLSLGTPHYMSPEQATGDRDVDPRSDVYALGCVLYEMLAGQPPFSAATAQAVLVQILTSDAPSITSMRRTVSPNVVAALAKSLEKLPADRFTSAAEFGTALADEGFTYKARTRTSVTASTPEPVATEAPGTMPGPWKRLTIATTTLAALLTALAAWGWLSRPPPSQPHPATRSIIGLGDMRFLNSDEVIVSSDGSRFAATGVVDGQRALYWRDAAEENFRIVPGTEGALNGVAFSPDGEWIVYGNVGANALYKVSLSGGAPTPVVPSGDVDVRLPHWGDDGTIVFTGTSGLYRVPDTGGEPVLLRDNDQGTFVSPTLLPGGGAVLGAKTGLGGIMLLDLETDSIRDLIPGGHEPRYVETGHILYVDRSGGLWAVPFDTARGEVLGGAVPIFEGLSVFPYGGALLARYSVSMNGTLVYSAGAGGAGLGVAGGSLAQRLAVVDLEGSEETLVLSERRFGTLKWSPDGRSVVYESHPQGESDAQIYTYDVEVEATPRQRTFEGDNLNPVYSPDGDRVVFSSQREGTDGSDLFVKRLDDDTPAELLITLPRFQRPTQWPSDTLIVFNRGPPPDDLWMLDLSDPDSPRAEAYLEQEADIRDMVVSPDGTMAAYSSDETGTQEIYVRSFPDPGERTPVSEGGGAFSPDGHLTGTLSTTGPDRAVWEEEETSSWQPASSEILRPWCCPETPCSRGTTMNLPPISILMGTG